ncbi:MAG: hypothetical protein ACP5N1_02395 [Candidatus Woesearchaeota archaeon]
MITQIPSEYIVYDKKIINLCRVPFYNHSKGCPNWNKKEGCPPNVPLIDKILDFNKELYMIYNEFPIGEFAEKMRLMHPEWQEHPRQWYNPRRWQGTARKIHKKERIIALEKGIDTIVWPEAHGVNVTGTMKNIGIILNWDWPPQHILENEEYKKNVSYIISIGGYHK